MQLQTQTVIDVAIENTSQPTEEHAFTPLDLSLAATGSSQDTVHSEPTPRIWLNLYQSMILCAFQKLTLRTTILLICKGIIM